MPDGSEKRISHCPLCGSQVDPGTQFDDETSVMAVIECPEHGELEVIAHE